MSEHKKTPITPVTPHPQCGEGIQRLNKRPLLILIAFVLIVASVFIVTLYKKMHPAHLSPTNEGKNAATSFVPPSLLEPDKSRRPAITPPKFLLKEQDKEQQQTKEQQPPGGNIDLNTARSKAEWDRYYQQRAQIQLHRQDMQFQALTAEPDSGNNSEELKELYTSVEDTHPNAHHFPKDTDYLEDYRTGARNAFEIKEGTLLPLILVSRINSDIPSLVKAQIRENVFDSATGQHILIPQGATLIGNFGHALSTGQARLNVFFHRIIFPDQSSIDLDSMQAVDLQGQGGLKDKVNKHWGKILGTSGISTFFELLQSPATLFSSSGSGNMSMLDNSMIGEQTGESGQEIARRSRQIRPTITIRSGYLFNVFTSKDIILPPYQDLWNNGTPHRPDPS